MMVCGVEGEAGYNGHSETVVGVPGPGALTSDIGFNGSVRARLGHKMGMALPFVSAGVAVARLDSDWPGIMNRSATLVGGVAGIGVDYQFTDKVFGRAAYDFTFYGNKTIQYCPGCLMRNSISTHTFKIGVGVNLN